MNGAASNSHSQRDRAAKNGNQASGRRQGKQARWDANNQRGQIADLSTRLNEKPRFHRPASDIWQRKQASFSARENEATIRKKLRHPRTMLEQHNLRRMLRAALQWVMQVEPKERAGRATKKGQDARRKRHQLSQNGREAQNAAWK